jgi:citrate synthase
MTGNSLSVTDNRTGKTYEIPIEHGAIRAVDLRQVKTGPDDVGLLSYDPAFMNTASCRSTITYIDGDRGILEYRGYPIEQLAERSSYLEVAYLLIHGQLPIESQLAQWRWEITHHTWIHENLKKFLDTFHHDAHPMAMLVSAVAALSTFYPEAKNGTDIEVRHLQVVRLIAKMPTLAAFAYRHGLDMPYAYPDNDLSYAGNFLNMLFKATDVKYQPNPAVERALDVLFILHADHEQNCSTNAVRAVGSSGGILAEARRLDAQVVVVGARGHGALSRLVLGSVSLGVVRQARTAVFVVKRPLRDAQRLLIGVDGSAHSSAYVLRARPYRRTLTGRCPSTTG